MTTISYFLNLHTEFEGNTTVYGKDIVYDLFFFCMPLLAS